MLKYAIRRIILQFAKSPHSSIGSLRKGNIKIYVIFRKFYERERSLCPSYDIYENFSISWQ